MAEPKLKPNRQSVNLFLDKIADETRRTECYAILDMMKRDEDGAEDLGRRARRFRQLPLQVRERARG